MLKFLIAGHSDFIVFSFYLALTILDQSFILEMFNWYVNPNKKALGLIQWAGRQWTLTTRWPCPTTERVHVPLPMDIFALENVSVSSGAAR